MQCVGQWVCQGFKYIKVRNLRGNLLFRARDAFPCHKFNADNLILSCASSGCVVVYFKHNRFQHDRLNDGTPILAVSDNRWYGMCLCTSSSLFQWVDRVKLHPAVALIELIAGDDTDDIDWVDSRRLLWRGQGRCAMTWVLIVLWVYCFAATMARWTMTFTVLPDPWLGGMFWKRIAKRYWWGLWTPS